MDYCPLNAKTRKDAFPLPRVEEALQVLMGARYFCSLDVDHGFNELQVAEEEIEEMAFRTGTGELHKYTRMLFRLSNSPATSM